MPTAELKLASVGKIPTITAGDLTPDILRRWENACQAYFTHSRAATESIALVAPGLEDPRIADWWCAERDRLIMEDWDDVVQEMRELFLDDDWQVNLRREILASRHTESGASFPDWANGLIAKNALLRGHAKHINNTVLIQHLEANMDPELQTLCDEEAPATFTGLDLTQYVKTVTRINKKLVTARKRATAAAEAAADALASRAARNIRKGNTATGTATVSGPGKQIPSGSGSVATSANSASATFVRLPKLTDQERQLLTEHEGCFKCRAFYAGHMSGRCPNGFPDAKGYVTRTEAMARAAKPPTVKKEPTPLAVDMARLEEVDFPTVAYDDYDSDECVPTNRPSIFLPLVANLATGESAPIPDTLVDTGSTGFLVSDKLVSTLQLPRRRLPKKEVVKTAIAGGERHTVEEFVCLPLATIEGDWTSKSKMAKICKGLAHDVVLGIPFLEKNRLTIAFNPNSVTTPEGLNLVRPAPAPPMPARPRNPRAATVEDCEDEHFRDLRLASDAKGQKLTDETIARLNVRPERRAMAEIAATMVKLEKQENLLKVHGELMEEFKELFPEDIPAIGKDPEPLSPEQQDLYHRINLVQPEMRLHGRNYRCPPQYMDAWRKLLDQHMAAGRIRWSNSPYASPSFIVPKKDPKVLPRWVNDYRALNQNTVKDRTTPPHIEDVLAAAGKAKYWAKLDMTNSF